LFTSVLVNIQLTKGSQIEPRDLIVFDWEKDIKKVEIPTEEDMQRILERDKKLLKHG